MSPARAFTRILGHLTDRVVPAYGRLGQLACAYGQGSLVEGLAEEADLDLVLVWTDLVPGVDSRPPAGLADPGTEAVVFDQPGFVLDRFFVSTQQLDVQHRTLADMDQHFRSVKEGEGRTGYPMPTVCLYGLTTGYPLYDPDGYLLDLRAEMNRVPSAYVEATRTAAREQMAGLLAELDNCVQRGDGLLCHSLAVRAVRAMFMAWFAVQGWYWPHEKRLGIRLERLGRSDLAEREAEVWIGHLAERRTSVEGLWNAIKPELDGD